VRAYGRIDVNVYWESTGRVTTTRQPRDFRGGNRFSADYQQQYLAKNPKSGDEQSTGAVGLRGSGRPRRSALGSAADIPLESPIFGPRQAAPGCEAAIRHGRPIIAIAAVR
jgi:hypothetical protein